MGGVSDELWALIEPVLPAGGHQGRPWNSHRLTLEGVIWRYRTGSPWRDVPDHFGVWQSVWERHRRWSDDGTYVRMFAAVRDGAPELSEQLPDLLSVDSTIARAHQHAAGARHGPTQGALSNDKNLANEAVDHVLGRFRGGLSTKIHALTDRFRCPLTVMLSGGHAGDNPHLAPLLRAHRLGENGTFRLLADKAYSHPSTRAYLRAQKIPHTIPGRDDQIVRRKAKGSAGGRPRAFAPETYTHRNTVERGSGRFKQWRGIATRYDKYATTYLGGVLLAAMIIHHRIRD